MRALNLIRKKRNGYELTHEELRYLIENYTWDGIPDYQMAAFYMAVYF
jgi:pyrimidine-nucleoside phosphorylase